MFNQEKTGKFIAEMRREQNLTQKQLAEMVGVSDKTVSKWETGRSLPDNAIMMDVCHVLQISVNELLSGERFPEEHYIGKAEENILELVKENEKQKKKDKYYLLGTALEFVILIVVCILAIFSAGGFYGFGWYKDIPTAFWFILITFGVMLASGIVRDFFRGFQIVYGRKLYTEEEIKASQRAMKWTMIIIPFAGVFIYLIGLVAIIGHLTVPELLGPNVAVALLSVFYSCIVELLLIPTAVRLWRK